jgi:hypothetical protein
LQPSPECQNENCWPLFESTGFAVVGGRPLAGPGDGCGIPARMALPGFTWANDVALTANPWSMLAAGHRRSSTCGFMRLMPRTGSRRHRHSSASRIKAILDASPPRPGAARELKRLTPRAGRPSFGQDDRSWNPALCVRGSRVACASRVMRGALGLAMCWNTPESVDGSSYASISLVSHPNRLLRHRTNE